MTLLSNWAWRIVVMLHSLFCRIFQAKYAYSTRWLFLCYCNVSSSNIKKSIIVGFSYLKGSCIWKIGNRSSIAMGHDPRAPSTLEFIPKLNPQFQNMDNLPVVFLFNKRRQSWNKNKITQIFHPCDALAIF